MVCDAVRQLRIGSPFAMSCISEAKENEESLEDVVANKL